MRVVGENKAPTDVHVRDVMSEECFWCSENRELEDAVRITEQNQERRLPRMNDNKEIVGMSSIEDVAVHAPASCTGEVLKAVAKKKGAVAAV